MVQSVTPAIPAAQLVSIIPSVLSAGGNALQLNGLILTQSTKPPIGQVLVFVDATDVQNYFGTTSQEAALAAIYFNGPDRATILPAEILFAQYPEVAVPGYLRSGSLAGVSLTTLQAVNATLTVTIDGSGSPTTSTVNLSAATSFANAAQIIAGALAIKGPQQAAFTASLATTVMTVTIAPVTGALAVGQIVIGTGIPANTYIASFGTGTGGLGTYNLSASVTTEAAEAIVAYAPGVTWDSTLSEFTIFSGTTGAASSVGFGSGAAATSLKFTQALGALVSAGAAIAVPGTFMDGIVAETQNWATFLTTWEPSDAEKEAFATWTNVQRNRYAYAMWETNILDTESNGPSAPVALINAGNMSGIMMIYQNPNVVITNGEKAAFEAGWAASLDFTRTNGRSTLAYKSQAGLLPEVFTGTIANTLLSFGINFYGDYTTANEAFTLMQNGAISGDFAWADSYYNQIWLNNALQLSILEGLVNSPSIPYNAVGYTLIDAFCMDPINAAVNFGAIVAGVALSQSQIAEVNQAAGKKISDVLFQRGWYLQILPAAAQVRAARSSPPCTLWYCDGGSIQKITLASIEIQ